MITINYKKIISFLTVIFFIGLIFQSCNKKQSLTQQEMEGYWVLKTLNGQDAKSQFAGALPTLQFNFEDGTISGTGGCNRYAGAYTYKDGIFFAPNLAVTQMLCTEDNIEGQFLLELTSVNNTLSIVNGLLTVAHDGKVALVFEKGSAPIENLANVDPQLLSGTWRLKIIDGVEASIKFGSPQETVPTLSFDIRENKISGNGGCNRYNATFSLNKDQLVVGPIMSTKMACSNLEGEAQFTQAIADTSDLSMPIETVLQVAKKGVVLLELEKVITEPLNPK